MMIYTRQEYVVDMVQMNAVGIAQQINIVLRFQILQKFQFPCGKSQKHSVPARINLLIGDVDLVNVSHKLSEIVIRHSAFFVNLESGG